jgi:thioredoxin-related protein
MRPRWQEIEKGNPWLVTTYYDFDQEKDMVAKYGIESGILPAFIFLDNQGKEIVRLNGEVNKETLIETINAYRNR